MPTTLIECNNYECLYMSKTGNLCTAKQIQVKHSFCITYKYSNQNYSSDFNPLCVKSNGKWRAIRPIVVR